MDTFGDKLRKTAGEVAERLGDAAHTASEKINEMRDIQRINGQIKALKKEKDRCKMAMADLLIRMFDQNTFAEALLRPEYNRIVEIDKAVADLEAERAQVAARSGKTVEEVEVTLEEETPAGGSTE